MGGGGGRGGVGLGLAARISKISFTENPESEIVYKESKSNRGGGGEDKGGLAGVSEFVLQRIQI